ncbi:MAG: hypothetical protein JWM91_2342 [Rhodospirillales bacterium]|nr:hypothetical protein [Rhodospirillales bacterium]
MKNIVLCCDGTANEFKKDRTNVVKLYAAIQQNAGQVTYYHPGVGTMEAVGALTSISRKVTKLLGLAIGYGLETDIRDAYVFLMNTYEPGDRVFLFGFSRGAYTVRALAALAHMYGLIPRGNEPLVPYAIRMLMAIQKDRPHDVFALAEEFALTFSPQPCPIHFVGVWDTVSSVGWIANPLKLPYTASNPGIAVGRHAVAIDERRAFFRQNLWHPTLASQTHEAGGPIDLKQVWFPGVHCDVGGGYPEVESGLAKGALRWMLAEANAHGLLLDKVRTDLILGGTPSMVSPDANAIMHESLTIGWWLGEFVPKKHYNAVTKKTGWRMNLFRRRTIPSGAWIHESVKERANYALALPRDAQFVGTLPLH